VIVGGVMSSRTGSGLVAGPTPKVPPIGYQPNPALAKVGRRSASVDEVQPPVNEWCELYAITLRVGAMS
jgi:hypothetical protein